MADEAEEGSPLDTSPRLSVNQSPGNFFLFWNVLVPFSVILNIRRFGFRIHEMGLVFALLLNPYILNKIVEYPFIAWLVSLFLIVWIERVLRRWAWYKIYSWSFFRSLFLLFLFIAVPSIVLTFIWRPIQSVLPQGLSSLNPDWEPEDVSRYRDLIMLLFAMGLLLHSAYFYTQCDHCITKDTCRRLRDMFFCGGISRKKKCKCCRK